MKSSGDLFAVEDAIDQGAAGVDAGVAAFGGGLGNDFPEAHEGLSAGLGVIAVEGDGEPGAGGDGLVVVLETEDVSLAVDGENEGPEGAVGLIDFVIFLDDFDEFFGAEFDGGEEVFVGQQFPTIADGDTTDRQVAGAESAVENAIDGCLIAFEGSREAFAEKAGEGIVGPGSLDGGGDCANLAGELFGGCFEIGPGHFHDSGIEGEGLVHENRGHSSVDEFAGFQVECQVNPPAVDAMVAGLGAEDVSGHPRGFVLMGVTGEKDVYLWGLFEGFPDGIGEVVRGAPTDVSHDDDGIRLGGSRFGDGFPE